MLSPLDKSQKTSHQFPGKDLGLELAQWYADKVFNHVLGYYIYIYNYIYSDIVTCIHIYIYIWYANNDIHVLGLSKFCFCQHYNIDHIIDSQRCRAQHEHHPALPRLNQDQLGQNWCITMSKAVKVPSKCEALMVKREAVRV